MRDESTRHPVALANLRPYLLYFFISAPVLFLTLPFAPRYEWRLRRCSPMLALWLVAFCANLLLFFNYSTTINWRYFLTGLPALAPPARRGLCTSARGNSAVSSGRLLHSRWLLFCLRRSFSFAVRPISFEFIKRRAMSKEYKHRLESVPQDAIMISGAQTIAVHYWAAIGDGNWTTIGTGGGWPGDKLFSTIDNHLRRAGAFLSTPIHAGGCRAVGSAMRSDDCSSEDHFRFSSRRGHDLRVRPLNDATARDHPNLQRLLPENRPDEAEEVSTRTEIGTADQTN